MLPSMTRQEIIDALAANCREPPLRWSTGSATAQPARPCDEASEPIEIRLWKLPEGLRRLKRHLHDDPQTLAPSNHKWAIEGSHSIGSRFEHVVSFVKGDAASQEHP